MFKLFALVISFLLLKLGLLHAQCDTFSREILQIIKTENYIDLHDHLQPIEEIRKILHWEVDSRGDSLLKILNDSLFVSLVRNMKDIRDSIHYHELDINSIQYLDCSGTEGINSPIKIRFTVGGKLDSLNVPTWGISDYYISQELEYHNEWIITPAESFVEATNAINNIGNSKGLFTPREKELELGIKLLDEYLKINSIEYNSYLFVLGYQNEKKQTILRYIVFMDESKIKLLDLDLEKKTWVEIISE